MTDHRDVDSIDEDPAWTRALARAAAQRQFYGHVAVFLLVGSLLVIIDVATGSSGSTFLGLDWAFWPIGGWGLAVVLLALRVFGAGSDWEERRAAKLYDKEQQRRSQRS